MLLIYKLNKIYFREMSTQARKEEGTNLDLRAKGSSWVSLKSLSDVS